MHPQISGDVPGLAPSCLASACGLGPHFTMNCAGRWIVGNWLGVLPVLICTGSLGEGCGGKSIGGSGQAGAGTSISVGSGATGGATTFATGGVGPAATGGTTSGECFSPTQNLSTAYQDGSKGCACDPTTMADACVQGVALICESNHWIAVEDGPCMPQYAAGGSAGTGGSTAMTTVGGSSSTGGTSSTTCFTPSANVRPGTSGGCPCALGSTSVCVSGTGFICSSGYWIAVWDGPCMPKPPGTGGTSSPTSPTSRSTGGIATASSGTGGRATGDTAASGSAAATKSCGARAGATCSSSEYCAYRPRQYCGQADAEATCQARPEACGAVYSPVCGCDGKTYGNSCEAAIAGSGVYATGACTR